MKISNALGLGFLVFLSHGLAYGQVSSQDKMGNSGSVRNARLLPSLFYSYTDFNYDSTAGINFQRYNGHANLYGVSASSFFVSKNVLAALGIYHVNSDVSSQTQLNPSIHTSQTQSVKNNTLFASVSKFLNTEWMANFTGGYGHNQVNSSLSVFPGTLDQTSGYAKSNLDNWFANLNALYTKKHGLLTFQGSLGFLYSYINTPQFVHYRFPTAVQAIASEDSKSSWLMENAQLSYNVTEKVAPFVTAGLIQSVNSSVTQPLITTLNGSLPQLNAMKNGYQAGGGVKFVTNKLSLILQYRYYNSGRIYESNQTSAALTYSMD